MLERFLITPVDTVNAPPEDTRDGLENASRLEIIAQLRAQLSDVLPDAETLWTASGQQRPMLKRATGSRLHVVFRGHMAMDPAEGYALLRERFAKLGYTPTLRRQGEYELVTAIPILFASSESSHPTSP